jgi:hypothetical protein
MVKLSNSPASPPSNPMSTFYKKIVHTSKYLFYFIEDTTRIGYVNVKLNRSYINAHYPSIPIHIRNFLHCCNMSKICYLFSNDLHGINSLDNLKSEYKLCNYPLKERLIAGGKVIKLSFLTHSSISI